MPASAHIRTAMAVAFLSIAAITASTEDNYESWAPLQNPFESTGGGGIMIDRYEPIVVGDTCVTDFTAMEPGGKVYYNKVQFEAVAVQGGILCTNGKWQALDGSMSGTTPFRVFIKDGVRRRAP